MALSRPLVVAIVAFALLGVSVGFEAAFHRTIYLDVKSGEGWQTIGQSATPGMGGPRATAAIYPIPLSPNGTLELRVRIDNGYPWSFSHHYDVTSQGLLVASGTVTAPGRDVGESSFTLSYAQLVGAGGKPTGTNVTFASVGVQVGNDYAGGSFQVQEAS